MLFFFPRKWLCYCFSARTSEIRCYGGITFAGKLTKKNTGIVALPHWRYVILAPKYEHEISYIGGTVLLQLKPAKVRLSSITELRGCKWQTCLWKCCFAWFRWYSHEELSGYAILYFSHKDRLGVSCLSVTFIFHQELLCWGHTMFITERDWCICLIASLGFKRIDNELVAHKKV